LTLLLALQAASALAASACPRNVWGFYPYYWHANGFTAATIEYDRLTAVVQFNIAPNADGSLSVPAGLLEPALVADAHAAGDKVLIDCGGGDSGAMAAAFSALAASPAARAAFVDKVAAFMAANGFDGFDMDWEFPQGAADRADLTLLMQALRAKFNGLPAPAPSWILAVELPTIAYWGQWYDAPGLAACTDYMDVEEYGIYGSWSSHSGHNAPLFLSSLAPPGDAGLDGQDAIAYWESRGVPAGQLQYGLSCFATGYAPTVSTIFAGCGGPCATTLYYYNQIPALLASGWAYNYDASAASPYLTKAGQGVISYDDPASIAVKAGYAVNTAGLAGVFCWDLYQGWMGGSGAAQQPILNAMWQAVQCPSATPTPSPTFTVSPTLTPSPTASPSGTLTPTFTVSPTASPSATISPTWTPGAPGGLQPRAYPDPFEPSRGQRLHFDQVEAGSRINIYDLVGRKVRSLAAAGLPQQDAWDGHNDNGQLAVTGVYLVVVTQPSGRKDTLRVAVLP
jgi:hypothetical protein